MSHLLTFAHQFRRFTWRTLRVVLMMSLFVSSQALAGGGSKVAKLRGGVRAGGGGEPDGAAVITKGKKTLEWLRTQSVYGVRLNLNAYQKTVRLLEKSMQPGHRARIVFEETQPLDVDGNPKPGVFELKPFRRIRLWRETWEAWQLKQDYKNLYLQTNQEILGLMEIKNSDRYFIAEQISQHWREIESIELPQPSYEIRLGLNLKAKVDGDADSQLTSEGTPGNSPAIWPARTLISAPIETVVAAFKALRQSELKFQDHFFSDENPESSALISIQQSGQGYLVIFQAKHLPNAENESAKLGHAFLKEARAGHFGFLLLPVDSFATEIQLLPDSQIIFPISQKQNEWQQSHRTDEAYTFSAFVNDPSSLFLHLEIFDPQREHSYELKIQYAKIAPQEPAYFEITAEAGDVDSTWILDTYGSRCLRGKSFPESWTQLPLCLR